MHRLACVTLCLAFILALLLPVAFGRILESSLDTMGIAPDLAFLILLGILIGGAINIPLRRFATTQPVSTDPLAILGLSGLLPRLQDIRCVSVVAINVGGCLIPVALAVHQVVRLVTLVSQGIEAPDPMLEPPDGIGTFIALFLATALNAIVCWKIARLVPPVGIVLPGIVPGITAAAAALLLAAEVAPCVAFVAGVLGPLVGGSILHLRDIRTTPVGLASVGGAGVFDAIVFSCVIAVYVT